MSLLVKEEEELGCIFQMPSKGITSDALTQALWGKRNLVLTLLL
jgi:hypothetical protein